jgi:hypothetical protein
LIYPSRYRLICDASQLASAIKSVAHPADTDNYKARVISVNQVGDAAVAVAVLAEDGFWGTASFVDFFSLARIDRTYRQQDFCIYGREAASYVML